MRQDVAPVLTESVKQPVQAPETETEQSKRRHALHRAIIKAVKNPRLETGFVLGLTAAAMKLLGEPRGGRRTAYLVRPGETIFSIARRKFGTDRAYEKLLAMNPQLTNRLGTVNVIYPGERVWIPNRAGGAAHRDAVKNKRVIRR